MPCAARLFRTGPVTWPPGMFRSRPEQLAELIRRDCQAGPQHVRALVPLGPGTGCRQVKMSREGPNRAPRAASRVLLPRNEADAEATAW